MMSRLASLPSLLAAYEDCHGGETPTPTPTMLDKAGWGWRHDEDAPALSTNFKLSDVDMDGEDGQFLATGRSGERVETPVFATWDKLSRDRRSRGPSSCRRGSSELIVPDGDKAFRDDHPGSSEWRGAATEVVWVAMESEPPVGAASTGCHHSQHAHTILALSLAKGPSVVE